MDAKKIISQLRSLHPGKNIYVDDPENPNEVLCELEPASLNPERSVYIAVIDKRVEHYHRIETKERFEVLRGELILQIAGREHTINAGRSHTLAAGQVHAAEGHGTWVKVISTPAWKPTEHTLIEEPKNNPR